MSPLFQSSISEVEFEHLDQYFSLTLSPWKLLERLEKSLKSPWILLILACIIPARTTVHLCSIQIVIWLCFICFSIASLSWQWKAEKIREFPVWPGWDAYGQHKEREQKGPGQQHLTSFIPYFCKWKLPSSYLGNG